MPVNNIKGFFSSTRKYAVVGASANRSKFGFKILQWYVQRKLDVTPINPKPQEILGVPVVTSITELVAQTTGGYDGISVSFLTPPEITERTLLEIAQVEDYQTVIKGLWFQPGSYDSDVIETAKKLNLYEKVIENDLCILVRGDSALHSVSL